MWFAGSRRATVTVPLGGKRVKSVTDDPDNRFQDLDRSNNVVDTAVVMTAPY